MGRRTSKFRRSNAVNSTGTRISVSNHTGSVNRASENTFSSLRSTKLQQLHILGKFNENNEPDPILYGSDSRIDPKDMVVVKEEDDFAMNLGDDNSSGKTVKRPRLVWTPQLHERFVDVVAHLGIKNAVPKTIMQFMNVEGLMRENVASHLQKYRLYLKRMQGLSNEGPSSSDHLFASTPVPQSLQQQSGSVNGNGHVHSSSNNNGHMPMPMMYSPQMVPMPTMRMSGHGHGHGFHHHPYNMAQQRDWSGNKFGPYHGDK